MGGRCSKRIQLIETVNKLRNIEILMKERILKYENDIACANTSIKSCIKNKRKAHAKILLRKRKIMEHDILNISNQILNIQKRISTLEGLELTRMQIESVTDATKVYKKFVSKNNIDRIDKLQEDMEDLTDQLCDINQLFEIDNVDINDVELEEEYTMLEHEAILELPEAPDHDISKETSMLMQAV